MIGQYCLVRDPRLVKLRAYSSEWRFHSQQRDGGSLQKLIFLEGGKKSSLKVEIFLFVSRWHMPCSPYAHGQGIILRSLRADAYKQSLPCDQRGSGWRTAQYACVSSMQSEGARTGARNARD